MVIFLCFHIPGAPIFLSAPHFYQAEQKFIEDIEGMHPTKEYHETFVDINPVSTAVLKSNAIKSKLMDLGYLLGWYASM